MRPIQHPRQLRFLARFVLAWFVLFVGASVASPALTPGSVQVVCSAGGVMKLVVQQDEDALAGVVPGMDCPLCAPVLPPPNVRSDPLEPPCALAHALEPVPAARIAWLTRAPLPARGPPLVFA